MAMMHSGGCSGFRLELIIDHEEKHEYSSFLLGLIALSARARVQLSDCLQAPFINALLCYDPCVLNKSSEDNSFLGFGIQPGLSPYPQPRDRDLHLMRRSWRYAFKSLE